MVNWSHLSFRSWDLRAERGTAVYGAVKNGDTNEVTECTVSYYQIMHVQNMLTRCKRRLIRLPFMRSSGSAFQQSHRIGISESFIYTAMENLGLQRLTLKAETADPLICASLTGCHGRCVRPCRLPWSSVFTVLVAHFYSTNKYYMHDVVHRTRYLPLDTFGEGICQSLVCSGTGLQSNISKLVRLCMSPTLQNRVGLGTIILQWNLYYHFQYGRRHSRLHMSFFLWCMTRMVAHMYHAAKLPKLNHCSKFRAILHHGIMYR